MPFYEYHCHDCGAEFQSFVKTMNPKPPKCEKCGGKKVKKMPSVFGVGATRTPPPPAGCGGCASSGSCPMAQ